MKNTQNKEGTSGYPNPKKDLNGQTRNGEIVVIMRHHGEMKIFKNMICEMMQHL